MKFKLGEKGHNTSRNRLTV